MGGKSGDGSKITRERAKTVSDKFLEMIPKEMIIEHEICGSYRRGRELIGDVELFMYVKEGFDKVLGPIVGYCDNGNVAHMYVLDGVQIDLFITEHECYIGSTKMHCTGSWKENARLRSIAKRKGMLLNQYGIWQPIEEKDFVENNSLYYRKRKNQSEPWSCYQQLAGKTEEGVYHALGQEYKKPEERDL